MTEMIYFGLKAFSKIILRHKLKSVSSYLTKNGH